MKLFSIISFFIAFQMGQCFQLSNAATIGLDQHFGASLKSDPLTREHSGDKNGGKKLSIDVLLTKQMYETDNFRTDNDNAFRVYSFKAKEKRVRRASQVTEKPEVKTGRTPAPESLPSTTKTGSSIAKGSTSNPKNTSTVPARSRRSPQMPEVPKVPAEIPSVPEGLPPTPEGTSMIPEGTIPKPEDIKSMASRSRRSPQLPEIPQVPSGIPPVPPLPEGVPPVPGVPPLPSPASLG